MRKEDDVQTSLFVVLMKKKTKTKQKREKRKKQNNLSRG